MIGIVLIITQLSSVFMKILSIYCIHCRVYVNEMILKLSDIHDVIAISRVAVVRVKRDNKATLHYICDLDEPPR